MKDRSKRLTEIAYELRELFPDAVSVELFVNQSEHSVSTTYKDESGPETGGSYKCLDGQWAHARQATN